MNTYSIVRFTYFAQYRPDDGRMPAETCCLKHYLICDNSATKEYQYFVVF